MAVPMVQAKEQLLRRGLIMALARYVHVGLSLDPKVEIVTPCDEFTVGENDDIQVFLGSELWAYYPAAIYSYLEEVEEPDAPGTVEGDAAEVVTGVLAPTDVDLSSSSNGAGPATMSNPTALGSVN